MTPHSLTTSRDHLHQSESESDSALRIRLRDGRFLSFTEYGAARGFPLFFLHDSGSSRIEAGFFAMEARRKGFRLIAVDRPGVGGSDTLPDFSREDCADDLLQLADALRLARFGLLGAGSGSAIALVAASRAPQRVAIVLGLSSHLPVANEMTSVMGQTLHAVLGLMLQWAIALRMYVHSACPDRYVERLSESLSYADRRLLDNSGIRAQLVSVAAEAVRAGGAGVARDMVLALSPLALASPRLKMPVHLWLGSTETSAAHQAQRDFSNSLPNGNLHKLNNRGRYFYWRHTEEVFAVAQTALSVTRQDAIVSSTRPGSSANTGVIGEVAMAG